MTTTSIEKLIIAIFLIITAVYLVQNLTEYAGKQLEKAAKVQTMARR